MDGWMDGKESTDNKAQKREEISQDKKSPIMITACCHLGQMKCQERREVRGGC